MGGRDHAADLRPPDYSRPGEEHPYSGHQRPDRPAPPLPGYGRLLHAPREEGRLAALKFTYVGDGNNVCHSLMFAAAKAGTGWPWPRPGLRAQTPRSSAGRRGRQGDRLQPQSDSRPGRGVRGADADLHGHLDIDGPGSRKRGQDQDFRLVSGQRRPDGQGQARTPSSCIACRPTGARRLPTR